MTAPFELDLGSGARVAAVRVGGWSELPDALASLDLLGHGPVLTVVGGAGGMTDDDVDRLRPLFHRLAGLVDEVGGAVVDGGTDSGVMRLMGEARTSLGLGFPLVGVAADGTVNLPDAVPRERAAEIDRAHSHVVLVPGTEWGDESRWISEVAGLVAATRPSVTVLVNGGAIAYLDAEHSLAAGRPVVAVAGSGRAADDLAAAVEGHGDASERARALVAGGRVIAPRLGESGAVRRAVAEAMVD